MTLVKEGAEQLIDEFGVYVDVFPQESQKPEDSSNPIFFENAENDTNHVEHKVRLYTSTSEEMLQDFGFEEDTESIMYSTEKIAEQGDKVEYENYKWNIKNVATNQIGPEGPYLFVFSMEGV